VQLTLFTFELSKIGGGFAPWAGPVAKDTNPLALLRIVLRPERVGAIGRGSLGSVMRDSGWWLTSGWWLVASGQKVKGKNRGQI
jgi:hypothetical protein